MANTSESANLIRSVAIIGSGMSGLTAATRLKDAGVSVVLFEKSRGPGGRLAAKRVGDGAIDIGAQYFTIRSDDFREFLDTYAGKDCYAQWDGKLRYQTPDKRWTAFRASTRYVGVPRMTAISRALSAGLDIRFETRISHLARDENQKWLVFDADEQVEGHFDAVIVTTPPAQARDLMIDSGLDISLQDPVFHDYPLQACWTVAARFSEPVPFDGDGLSAEHPILQWAANNSSKPGRASKADGGVEGDWWVLHARADWSEMHQHASADWVREQMLNGFAEVIDAPVRAEESRIHRWLYAKTASDQKAPGHRWYPVLRVGLCGDWLQGGRVEGAFESAGSLLDELRQRGAIR
ncbi:FAD-binding protein [Marinobacter nanhaiticus D15-8W]|uniref:FAD-binding protein n=1 Tax=Marinobacter nanhaiticus D15-8W TaxID=626887 RepID=N6WYM0_9GAMM|nr:FAD-dependent oxidoreductase [Marinobacter nanhaiticus]ENO13893.2 FAD-binding protein [Marinobacter nanhaiticus D15-8W]